MHSRIYQVSEIPNFIKAIESDIPKYFYNGGIADYYYIISEENEINEQWTFLEYLNSHGIKTDDNLLSFTINDNSIKEYFSYSIKNFKNIISILEGVDEDVFAGRKQISCDPFSDGVNSDYHIDILMHLLKSNYNDEFGIYILELGEDSGSTCCSSFTPLDDYLRNHNSEETTLYLGSVFDYHF